MNAADIDELIRAARRAKFAYRKKRPDCDPAEDFPETIALEDALDSLGARART
jgi:hypothetical protein